MYRKDPEPSGHIRPSHWHEDPNQRTDLNESQQDYPDTTEELAVATQEDQPEDYGWTPDDTPPVRVEIVQPLPASRVYRTWASLTVTLGSGAAVQIGEVNRARTSIIIRNIDDMNDVVLVKGPTDQNFTGYTLPPGEELSGTHTEAVWARSSTDTAVVTVFCEYEIDEE